MMSLLRLTQKLLDRSWFNLIGSKWEAPAFKKISKSVHLTKSYNIKKLSNCKLCPFSAPKRSNGSINILILCGRSAERIQGTWRIHNSMFAELIAVGKGFAPTRVYDVLTNCIGLFRKVWLAKTGYSFMTTALSSILSRDKLKCASGVFNCISKSGDILGMCVLKLLYQLY